MTAVAPHRPAGAVGRCRGDFSPPDGYDATSVSEWLRGRVYRHDDDPDYVPRAPLKPRRVRPARPLAGLPRWVFHGSRYDMHALLLEGFRLDPASYLSASSYSWEADGESWDGGINWAPKTWAWFESLTPAQRGRVESETGHKIRSVADLGEAVSILFVSDEPTLAERYGNFEGSKGKHRYFLALDTCRMAVLGWFRGEEEGPAEIVLVLPAVGWQGDSDSVAAVLRRSSARSARARLGRADNPQPKRADGPKATRGPLAAREEVARWLDEATRWPPWPTTVQIARALKTSAPQLERTLVGLQAARLLRRGSTMERGRRVDGWRPRRRDLTDLVVRVLFGEEPVPPPRPFLGDAEGFIMPPQPPRSAGVKWKWTAANLRVTGPSGGTLAASAWTGRTLGRYLEEESMEGLAAVVGAYEDRRIGYIEEVSVPPEARGGGEGRMLVAQALRALQRRGAEAVFLRSQPLDSGVTLADLDEFYRDAGLHRLVCCGDDPDPPYWFDFTAKS